MNRFWALVVAEKLVLTKDDQPMQFVTLEDETPSGHRPCVEHDPVSIGPRSGTFSKALRRYSHFRETAVIGPEARNWSMSYLFQLQYNNTSLLSKLHERLPGFLVGLGPGLPLGQDHDWPL